MRAWRVLTAVALFIALLAPVGARADQPEPNAIDKAKEMLTVTNELQAMDTMLGLVSQSMEGLIERANPGHEKEVRDFMTNYYTPEVRKRLPEFGELIAEVWARYFTAEELDQLHRLLSDRRRPEADRLAAQAHAGRPAARRSLGREGRARGPSEVRAPTEEPGAEVAEHMTEQPTARFDWGRWKTWCNSERDDHEICESPPPPRFASPREPRGAGRGSAGCRGFGQGAGAGGCLDGAGVVGADGGGASAAAWRS